VEVKKVRARKILQHEPGMLPVSERGGFACVEQTLSEEAARAEASRCLQCSTFCDKCVEVCPNRANYTVRVEPGRWTLPVLACQDGALVTAAEEVFQVTQARQIVHVEDLCNECGNCATFCVHQGKPYQDKPRLFLDEGDFLTAEGTAYRLEGDTLRRRAGGQEARLTASDGALLYEDGRVRLGLSPELEVREMALRQAFEGTLSLRAAAEMATILEGLRGSLPFLASAGG
jgi:putative selenate reductase